MSGCSNVDTVQHIEAFVIETTTEDQTGYQTISGYKKVNSIVTYETSKHHKKTILQAIEDYYDVENNYLNTLLIYETYTQTYVNKQGKEEQWKKEIEGPITILLGEDMKLPFVGRELTTDEMDQIKEHVILNVNKANP